MKVAWLFPGQGSQRVGMGRELFERYESARRAFSRADAAIPIPLQELCFDGPESELTKTANLQPCLVATSIATLVALRERHPGLLAPTWAAGHSLGEYSALVSAGALNLAEAVRIVHERGKAMQAAVPEGEGAMLAVIGGDEATVEALCAETRGDDVLSPANFNCPGQIVIAGHTRAIERARALTKSRGLRGIPLKVSAPFHSHLMRPARERMETVLSEIQWKPLDFGIVTNVDAEPNADAGRVREILLRQIEGAVRWQQSLEFMLRSGVTHAIEIGPGEVLAGLVKKTAPTISVMSVSDSEGVERVAEFLGLAR